MATTTHSKRCLASAIICAVENERDNEENTDVTFRQADFLAIGQGYLADGIATCQCHVGAIAAVQERYEVYGAQEATDLAASYLNCGYLSVSQYMDLVKWSEGRGPLAH